MDLSAAGRVAEAKHVASAGDFDLIISDIGLPDGTGWVLMHHLRAHGLTRGIALTGFGMVEDERRSLRLKDGEVPQERAAGHRLRLRAHHCHLPCVPIWDR